MRGKTLPLSTAKINAFFSKNSYFVNQWTIYRQKPK